ncbi:MAG: hypothetical protein J0L99_17820 [Chitinophagales bacterium]|nr:hypothetical protein [Chitinophagales bacterium]
MHARQHDIRITLCLLLLGSTLSLLAQPKLNSPYSRYGFGDPVSQQLPVQTGSGGQTAAYHDPYHLNLSNPAALAHLRTTSFETGLYSKYSNYEAGNNKLDVWSGNIGYFALGFTLKSPINELLDRDKSKWHYGMGLSLTPFSHIGYNVETRDTLPQIGNIANTYQGSGGVYRLNWGSAARYKHTAFGINLGWVFGEGVYENTTFFSDSILLPSFQNNFLDQNRYSGFIWNAGVQHDFILKLSTLDKETPAEWITVGLNAESQHNIGIISDVLRLRSRGKTNTDQYTSADTLFSAFDLRQTMRLPAQFSVGIQYVKVDKLRLGAEFDYATWSNYENPARPQEMRNTFGVRGGIEYTPDNASYKKYLRRVRYRAGAYYRQDPRIITQGQEINDVGLTLGLGFPLILPRQQTSFVDIALELGRYGANTDIAETYGRLTVGFSLNDNSWFYKRRFE